MDFDFNEEQNMLRETIRDFARKEIAPLVDETEAKDKFPLELIPRMGGLGYLCIWAPEEYGGGGMDRVAECIVNEELAYVHMGIAEVLVSSHHDGGLLVYKYGNEDQRQRFVVPAVKGEKIAAIAATEPEAGSDVAAIKTKAVKDGNDYILNGSKIFITGGTIADYVAVLAYTDSSKGPREGMSLFIVEKEMPGFSSKKLNPVGQKGAEVAELAFEDCRVPRENLLGKEGSGFRMMMDILAGCRINHAARSLGMARAAFNAAVAYAKERVAFGQPIARYQAIEFKLATMATEIETMHWMIYYAAWLQDQGRPFRKETAMAKFYAAEATGRVIREAVHIHGGYGLMMDSPLQIYLRDAEFQNVTEGTQEMLLMTIGREILK